MNGNERQPRDPALGAPGGGSVPPTGDSRTGGPSEPVARGVAPTPAAKAPSSTGSSLLPAVSVPKGGGAIKGIGEKFTTNPATGTASLSVPIATSPGRAGFGLSLSLSYDSGSGNGPFGAGFSLSVPQVSRKTDKGLPKYTDADVFVLSGAEDLVPVVDDVLPKERDGYRIDRYRPRTEGLFARIERWTEKITGDAHFRVTTKDNVLNVYGRSASARIADPEKGRRIFSWLLDETRDDRGNVARYTYQAEDDQRVYGGLAHESNRHVRVGDSFRFTATAQRYLKRIEYGNRRPNEAADFMFEVVFDYGDHGGASPTPDADGPWPVRADAFSSYRAGFEVRTYRLCRRALMFHRFPELGEMPALVRSTDFAYEEAPALTYLTSVTHAGYLRRDDGTYERKALPPLEFDYQRFKLNERVERLDRESLLGIGSGVGPATGNQWVDLGSEGLPGVFTETSGAWYYKAPRGGGKLTPPRVERTMPAGASIGSGAQQLMDLGGDGQLDLVRFRRPMPGHFARTDTGDWKPFRAFSSVPNVNFRDPNLRMVDLTGDGHADLLVSEDHAFTWYPSLGKEGFASARYAPKPPKEADGAAIVFANATESIHLADMTGDGLPDIVRVCYSSVCYWPNLGYGRFGRKVTMSRSPVFAHRDDFDPRRVRFADIDGTGTSDVVYLGWPGTTIALNQAGNSLSEAIVLRSLPHADGLSSISVVDLLGQGTSCLVWSSPLPGREPVLYVDLSGGVKPHLMKSVKNNLGAETRIRYAPSTKFYLEDKKAGKPWLTRLPFPVQVVERTERYDHVNESRFVSRFRYHHGYFDGEEREFRGFAAVEQWDAESFSGDRGKGLFPDAPTLNEDDELRVPPVHTKTWFHTGAWLERERLELGLAREYYSGDAKAQKLPDTLLPRGLSAREERDVARALRGSMLRQEVYADDDTDRATHPYTVTESNSEVRVLQRRAGERAAVVFTHPREQISLHYERHPEDPRTAHQLTLAVDDFGNVLESASVVYPRRSATHPEQRKPWVTWTRSSFVSRADEADWYRVSVPVEQAAYEVTGMVTEATDGPVALEAVKAAIGAAEEIPYEVTADRAKVQRRLIERSRTVYQKDDLSGPLPLGAIETLALPFESYRQAFTPGLISDVFDGKVTEALLRGEGHYVEQEGAWWAPSGRIIHDADRFYLPVAAIDAFGARYEVEYDAHALLVLGTTDPLGNRVSVENDYRVLGPKLVTDPNENRTAATLDALGMVTCVAVMGKADRQEGDTLDDPTMRFEYDLDRYRLERKPVSSHALAREKHGAENPRFQETYSYSDGFGREVMKKVQAEPGLAPVRGGDGGLVHEADGTLKLGHTDARWVGSGRTVFDNKGNPVKQYEPFFSATHEYEDESELVEWGVTPVLRYDPLGRLIRSDLPDGTYSKVEFDAWTQVSWDQNDTVADSAWRERVEAEGTDQQTRALMLALRHAGTPSVAHLDTLGRTFLSAADNGARGKYETRVELDIEGNQISVTDARGVVVMRQRHDMLSRVLYTSSPDAGERWAFADVANGPVRRWDSRGQVFRHEFDVLRRPTHLYVTPESGAEFLAERTLYGESHPEAVKRNLRTRPALVFDGVGVVENVLVDFKGNTVETTRRLASDYQASPDWSVTASSASPEDALTVAEGLLESEAFTTSAAFDALNRVISQTTSDGSETRPHYNEANLLERVEARVRAASEATTFVENVDYNARGQRELVEYGNGTRTEYSYDPETFRLRRMRTVRASDGKALQDLRYITEIRDFAQQDVYFGGDVVSANGRYEYDALYQLVSAAGREQPGQQPTADDPVIGTIPHPNDLNALHRYVEEYQYDQVGNVERMVHKLASGGVGWTRRYEYAEDSNRLLRTSAPGDRGDQLSDVYAHDAHGNMVRVPHLPAMGWDHADRLRHVGKGGGGDVYFTYDAAGERVRKVYVHSGLVEERVYVGGFEVYRKRRGTDLEVERETLHVADGERRVALAETTTVDSARGGGFTVTTRLRYQIDNHLGSSSVETDEAGRVITFEEYFPFGGTSFHSARSGAEVSRKRYRYTGKEKDEETGLYYHGARYYAPWLGRWTAADPAGLVDGLNVYSYARNAPLRFSDPTGTQSEPQRRERAVEGPPQFIPADGGGGTHLFPDGSRVEELAEIEIRGTVSAPAGTPPGGTTAAGPLSKAEASRFGGGGALISSVESWVAGRLGSLQASVERKKQEHKKRNWAWNPVAAKREFETIAKLTIARDEFRKELRAGIAHGIDLLNLANVVRNEAGAQSGPAKKAIAYAWLNRTGGAMRVPTGQEISHFSSLRSQWSKYNDTEKQTFLEQFVPSIRAARERLDDTNPGANDPTGGATHWVSPEGLEKYNPANMAHRAERYSRTYGTAQDRAFPDWARDHRTAVAQAKARGPSAIFNSDHKEFTVAGVPGTKFLFYTGIK